MFRKRTYSMILLGGIICIFIVIMLFYVSSRDRAAYDSLMKSSNPQKYSPTHLQKESFQKRHCVAKEMWYQDGDTPLHIWIYSKDSEIFLFQNSNQIAVNEQMFDVTGYIQEQLFYTDLEGNKLQEEEGQFYTQEHLLVPFNEVQPKQKIRYFKAKKATQFYDTNYLLAKDVIIETYICPGHLFEPTTISGELVMQGNVDQLEITFKDMPPKIVSQGLDAIYYTNQKGYL